MKSLINPKAKSNHLIIGGEKTGILSTSNAPHGALVQKLYKFAMSLFWIPENTPMSEDIKDLANLPSNEKQIFKEILAFLIFLDSINTVEPMEIVKNITAGEFTLLFAKQVFDEALHSQSYSYITESLFSQEENDEIYDMWRNNPDINKRVNYIVKFYDEYNNNPDDPKALCKALLANYVLEGLYFYIGFKYFYWLSNAGKMTETATIIKLINRDEIFHLQLYKEVIKLIRSQGKWELSDHEVFDFFQEAVQRDLEFNTSLLSNIIGFQPSIVEKYLKYLANRRLKDIGYKENPFQDYTDNPYYRYDGQFEKDSDEELPINNESNVFTSNETNYLKSDTLDWSGV